MNKKNAGYFSGFIFSVSALLLSSADTILIMEALFNFSFTIFHAFLLHLFLCAVYAGVSHLLKGHADHFLFMVLFLPAIGFLLVFLGEIFARYSKNTGIIDDYDRYVHYINNLIMLKPLNYHSEMNVMSTVDSLQYSDRAEAKNAVVNLTANDPAVKVAILKKALNNEDHEIVHYAASTLTLMEQEYEHRLEIMRGKYNQDSTIEQLFELAACYNEYISSGLLDGDVLAHYRTEMQGVLDHLSSAGSIHYEAQLLSIGNLIHMRNFNGAEDRIQQLLVRYPESYEPYLLLMKVYYLTGRIADVSLTARKVREQQFILPVEEESIIDFWQEVI